MVCCDGSAMLDAKRKRQRKRRPGSLPRPGEKILQSSVNIACSGLTIRWFVVAISVRHPPLAQHTSGLV